MVVRTPWVRVNIDVAAAPAAIPRVELNARAALTVAEARAGGTISVRGPAGRLGPMPGIAAIGA